MTTINGLLVAYLDGRYNAAAYKSGDADGGARAVGCRYHGEGGE